eukprot:11155723-Lingulodinium_polyedra.AAC.1
MVPDPTWAPLATPFPMQATMPQSGVRGPLDSEHVFLRGLPWAPGAPVETRAAIASAIDCKCAP